MAREQTQEAWEKSGVSFPEALKQGLVSSEKLQKIRNDAAAEIAYATSQSVAAPNFSEIERKAKEAMDFVLGRSTNAKEGRAGLDWFLEETWKMVEGTPQYRDEYREYVQAHAKMFLGKFVAEGG